MDTPKSAQRYMDRVYQAYGRLGMGWQLAIFLLVALSITWGLVAFGLQRLHGMAEQESKLEISNLAHAFAEEVNSSVNMIDLSLIGLRANWVQDRASFRNIVHIVQRHLHGNISFHVSIVDAAGRVAFSSVDPSVKPIDVSDREHIRVHQSRREDKLFISKPLLGRISKQWSTQFTRPVYTPDGRFDGVIVISVAPSYFSRFYKQINLGEDAVVTLVREGGTILARSPHQDEGRGMGQVLPGGQFLNVNSLSSGFYQRVSYVDGMERVYAWRTLPQYGLVVMVGQSVMAISKRYSSEQQAYIWGGISISALLAVIGYLLLAEARQRARAAEVLGESEARLRLAVEGSGDGVWDWDSRQPALRLSKRAREILRIGEQVVPSMPEGLNVLVHPEDVAAVRATLLSHIKGETPAYLIEHRTLERDGSCKWVLARGMVVKRSKDGQPLRMVGTYGDIGERKSREKLIEHLAQHDALTDLPNRVLFGDRLRQALLRAKRDNTTLAVIYFDLDKFKPVNDTYGHGVGDLLLIAVASRVRGVLRGSDTVARIGGDEFVVLLPRISAEADAIAVAETILAELNRPFEIGGHTLHISGSVGVAAYPKHAEDEAELMQCADQAMYQAKENGRNRVQSYMAEELT
ncbi:MAG TPA: diguanylate cyclase [Burkholderiaceae bacterium]|nr:diguanylate cyclase [Burkholderiaceae bacterium]